MECTFLNGCEKSKENIFWYIVKADMVVPACNSVLRGLRQEDHEFQDAM